MVMVDNKPRYDEQTKEISKSLVGGEYNWQNLTIVVGEGNQNWFYGFIDSPLHAGKYRVLYETDLEDGGYVVSIPTLHGCITEADDLEEAFISIKNALEGWIAVAQEEGLVIPTPDEL